MMKTPVLFFGHGNPMLAIEDNEVSRGLKEVGKKYIERFGKPKGILMVSAHWYTKGTFVQSAKHPEQIYDMYGFPKELYEVKYPVDGYRPLTERVIELLDCEVNDSWGIDHGTWTVLKHVFPKADIPVVQLSVDATCSAEECLEMGKKLSVLREEGYLIAASGNVVHNLSKVNWDMKDGTLETNTFNDTIISIIENKDINKLVHYDSLPYASYAVPTPDHFLPLLYTVGASQDDSVTVFNNVCDLGSMSMTSFWFE